MIYGAIEGGGTKYVCAILNSDGEVIDEIRYETTNPEETLTKAATYFHQEPKKHGDLTSLVIATFGPVELNPKNTNYGTILTTPKPNWEGTQLIDFFQKKFPAVSLQIDTDVNAAALGEWKARGLTPDESLIYVTVGTGIGGGVVVGGKTLKGYPHPEIGHLPIPSEEKGNCDYHQNCVEGLASGAAMEKRWGRPAYEIPPEHQAWQIEARHLALLAQTLTATFSPKHIIFGGGVMEQDHLLDLVKNEFSSLAGGYWDSPEDYLQRPMLGNQSAVLGCLEIEKRQHAKN
nr:fructokinase-like [Nerophis lumbriciformis]